MPLALRSGGREQRLSESGWRGRGSSVLPASPLSLELSAGTGVSLSDSRSP